jgi:hypothetical protein
MTDDEYRAIRQMFTRPGEISGLDPEDVAGNFLGPLFPCNRLEKPLIGGPGRTLLMDRHLAAALAALQQYLALLPSGTPDPEQLEPLLFQAWDAFEFEGDETNMAADKLIGRMEDPLWDPPTLSFKIERHGPTVKGSSRAELHRWQLDVSHARAIVTRKSYRQVSPRQPPFDVNAAADEIANLIATGRKDARLRWRETGRVQVLIGKILPRGSAVRETLADRRRRLAGVLSEKLAASGWVGLAGAPPHTYHHRP